jgi:hypothetical protein
MLLSLVCSWYQSSDSWFVAVVPKDCLLTFITSSSLFSLLDRAVFFLFAEACPAFIFEDADIVALETDQNKPGVVVKR